jgi:hypothetical protein
LDSLVVPGPVSTENCKPVRLGPSPPSRFWARAACDWAMAYRDNGYSLWSPVKGSIASCHASRARLTFSLGRFLSDPFEIARISAFGRG